MDLVEVWFGIINGQIIRRGVFTSVQDVNAKIRQPVTSWNDRKRPFACVKAPEEIFAETNPEKYFRHTALGIPRGSFCDQRVKKSYA